MIIKNLLPDNIWVRLATYVPGSVSFVNYGRQLQGKTYSCTITYPLKNFCKFSMSVPENRWPVDYIVEEIVKKYREIYKEEEETLNPENTKESVAILNRGMTDGKWGIWGHSLSDLDLVRITLDTDTNELTLGVDS